MFTSVALDACQKLVVVCSMWHTEHQLQSLLQIGNVLFEAQRVLDQFLQGVQGMQGTQKRTYWQNVLEKAFIVLNRACILIVQLFVMFFCNKYNV